MSKRMPVLISITFMLLASAVLLGQSFVSLAQKKATGAQWEYCAIGETFSFAYNDGKTYSQTKILYFEPTGLKEESAQAESAVSLEKDPAKLEALRQKSFANAMTQLGSQGWELVGEAPYPHKGEVLVRSSNADS